MAQHVDEDDYSDSGFDELPVNVIDRLERHAAVLSQQPQSYGPGHEYPNVRSYARHSHTDQLADDRFYDEDEDMDGEMPGPPSSDYGFDDEDVIDLDDPATANGEDGSFTIIGDSASRLPNNYANPDTHIDRQNSTHDEHDHPTHEAPQRRVEQHEGQSDDFQRFHARIAELERERETLQQSLEEAKTNAMSNAGAIAILRSKHEKTQKEHDRKVIVMQKLHAEETARHKAEIEAARKDQETAKTNNKFLEHDLAEEMERSKRLKGVVGPGVSGGQLANRPNHRTASPRMSQVLPFRDGFDDHEIVAISPSKSKERDRNTTPKAGGKRKRQVEASPGIPLAFSPAKLASVPRIIEAEASPKADSALLNLIDSRDANLQALRGVLNHAPFQGHKRTVEALGNYQLPTTPKQSLSSLLLRKLSRVRADEEDTPAVQICAACMDLWERCLAMSYYSPLYLIVDLLQFVLFSENSGKQIMIVDRFIPLAIRSIDLIAVPRARSASNRGQALKAAPSRPTGGPEGLDESTIIYVLHSLALGSKLNATYRARFWHKMEFTFILLMLNRGQPLPQITLMLQMVASSALSDSFGAINPKAENQAKNEADTIDRLTSLLFEVPETPPHEEQYTAIEVCNLRVEILRTLASIVSTTHGSVSLAQHRQAIGRLIRFLDMQVSSLYTISPFSLTQALSGNDVTRQPSLHDITIMSVNLTTRLLYHLLHNHADLINLRDKLAVIRGGHHKFLVAFSRLAFSEQILFEAGLDEEVVDAAHEILDAVLSPEEGEAVVQAIETPKGPPSTRVSVQPFASAPG